MYHKFFKIKSKEKEGDGMAKVIPFRGYRYNTEIFGDLNLTTAPPYDIISDEKRTELYERSPYNIVRIDYGMDQAGDSAENNKYTRAGKTLKDWIANQILIQEDAPAFYVYEEVFSLKGETQKSFKGILSLVQLEEFSKGIILPHEQTISKAKADRYDLMCATEGNLSPIYSLYTDGDGEMTTILYNVTLAEPDISFTTDENVRQNIWLVKDSALLEKITASFINKQLFIADGHHRYETALAYRDMRRERDKTENAPYDYVMMMLVAMEDSGLKVFPTHRMIHSSGTYDETMLIGCLTEDFEVSKIFFTEGNYADIITARLANTLTDKLFGLYTGEDYYYLLKLKNYDSIDGLLPEMSEAYRHLDVTILHSLILERYLDIDQQNMAEQRNLTYTRSAQEAIDEVRARHKQCAFLINATKIKEIRQVSSVNEKMPQKSTYFWPKLITGIVINLF